MVRQVTGIPGVPRRKRSAHKGSFGTVLIVAGSHGMLGAAILAARGALRGGAGLVRCALPADLMAPLTVAVPSATTLDRDRHPLGDDLAAAAAVVCGPGLSTSADALRHVRAVCDACRVPVVLDADALTLNAPLRAPLALGERGVLTPHPGEAARLLDTTVAEVQADRNASAIAVAERSGGICVLKGAGTVVTDGQRLWRNKTGNPGMATGGSGDVLAGLIGALIAQGMQPFQAACLGVKTHGLAGDLVAERLSEPGLIAEDLPLAIAEVLAQ